MSESDETLVEFFEKFVFSFILTVFLPLIIFISAILFFEGGGASFVRSSRKHFVWQEQPTFTFRVPTKGSGRTGRDREATTFGKFLFETGLYLLPSLVNFAFEPGAHRSYTKPLRLIALRNSLVSAAKSPAVGEHVGGESGRIAGTLQ